VVSDRAVFAYLVDVFVVPKYRGRGISKALMRAVLDHPDLQNLLAWALLAYNVVACVTLAWAGTAMASGALLALSASVLHGLFGAALLGTLLRRG
jgi:GNAT superfamily N-acetyltransferase